MTTQTNKAFKGLAEARSQGTVFSDTSGTVYQVRRRATWLRDSDRWLECAVIARATDANGQPFGLGVHTLVCFRYSEVQARMKANRLAKQ